MRMGVHLQEMNFHTVHIRQHSTALCSVPAANPFYCSAKRLANVLSLGASAAIVPTLCYALMQVPHGLRRQVDLIALQPGACD